MVFGLGPFFEELDGAAGVLSSGGEHLQKVRLTDVKRTGTRDQNPAWTQHLEGPQVQLFIAAQGRFQIAF